MARARRRRGALIAVTGTPGVGKKTVAPIVAGLMRSRLFDLNALALFYSSWKDREERLIDVGRVRSRLRSADLSDAVVFGHLVPGLLDRGRPDFVAVLRCEPSELKTRLLARDYPADKVAQNVEAELIGVVLDDAVRAFGPQVVHEYDTTRSRPAAVAKRVVSDHASGAPHKESWTDWTLDYDSPTKLRSLLSSARTDPAST